MRQIFKNNTSMPMTDHAADQRASESRVDQSVRAVYTALAAVHHGINGVRDVLMTTCHELGERTDKAADAVKDDLGTVKKVIVGLSGELKSMEQTVNKLGAALSHINDACGQMCSDMAKLGQYMNGRGTESASALRGTLSKIEQAVAMIADSGSKSGAAHAAELAKAVAAIEKGVKSTSDGHSGTIKAIMALLKPKKGGDNGLAAVLARLDALELPIPTESAAPAPDLSVISEIQDYLKAEKRVIRDSSGNVTGWKLANTVH